MGPVRRRMLGTVHAAAALWLLGAYLYPVLRPVLPLALLGAWCADRVLRGNAETVVA